MLDLDQIESRPRYPELPWTEDTIDALIAELRASRKVVQAAQAATEAYWDAVRVADEPLATEAADEARGLAMDRLYVALSELSSINVRSECQHEFGALGAASGSYCIHCGAHNGE